jgi:adenylate cyclase
MALGPLVTAANDVTDPEVDRIFGRAQELALDTGQSDLLFQATRGRGHYYNFNGDFDTALKFIDQLFQQAGKLGATAYLLEANHAGWGTDFIRGSLEIAKENIDAGLAIYDPGLHHDHIRIHGHDPAVCAISHESTILWLLGCPDKAQTRMQMGLDLAMELGHPYSTGRAMAGAMWVAHRRGEHQKATMRARELLIFARENRFPAYVNSATLISGASLIREGELDEGMIMIDDMLRVNEEIGANVMRPTVVTEYLIGCLASGAVEAGLSMVDQEFADQPYSGQRLFESEIRRLYGELLAANGEDKNEQAEEQMLMAVDIARGQEARSLELRALMSLARLWQRQGRQEEARQALAECYGWLTRALTRPT